MAHSILLVEDETNIRRLFADVLEDEGFEVRQACDGAAALEAVAREIPDLVILDLHMPWLDGLQFLRALDESRLRLFPVIVVSGNTRAPDLPRLVDAVLQKPVDLDLFVRCVLRVLRVS